MFTTEELKSKRYRYWKNYNVPRRFFDFDIKTFKSTDEISKKSFKSYMKFLNNLENNLKEGNGLLFVGPTGVGKTTLMTQAMIRAIDLIKAQNAKNNFLSRSDNPMSAYFTMSEELCVIFKGGIYDNKERKKRDALLEVSLLCIDDLGKLVNSEKDIKIIENIVKTRDHNLVSTFITSQIKPKDLKDEYASMVDIFRSRYTFVKLMGNSKRSDSEEQL